MSRSPGDVLVRPVITEKTSTLQFEENQYTFEVAPDANKPEIRRAVEEMFEVRVLDVRTMNVRGKGRRVRGRWEMGRKPHWKKAIVTLAEDDMIDLYEGV